MERSAWRPSRASRPTVPRSWSMASARAAAQGVRDPGARRRRLFLVPGGENAWAVLGDGNGELEMGGQRAIGGVDRPVVLAHTDLGAAGVHHRLDRKHHPRLELGT